MVSTTAVCRSVLAPCKTPTARARSSTLRARSSRLPTLAKVAIQILLDSRTVSGQTSTIILLWSRNIQTFIRSRKLGLLQAVKSHCTTNAHIRLGLSTGYRRPMPVRLSTSCATLRTRHSLLRLELVVEVLVVAVKIQTTHQGISW